MVNWYMVVEGMFGKHVPKWEKKHGKLVHACNKSKEGEKNNNPTGVRLLFI